MQNPRFKLSATLADENNSIVALLSDNAAQDLFGSTADKLIPDDDINCRGQLPAIATTVQGIAKKMKLRITNTSTDTNIRFMITDIEKSNPQETAYPTTPAPHHRSPSKDNEKDCSSVPQHSRANVRRSLPFESQGKYFSIICIHYKVTSYIFVNKYVYNYMWKFTIADTSNTKRKSARKIE